MSERIENISVTVSGREPTSGTVTIHERSKSERTARALKVLLIVWGIGAVSLFIPIAHFFLVPICLLAGPLAASYVNSVKSVIIGGNATCPNCQKEFEIVKTVERWPLNDICTHCNRHVHITRKSQLS